MDLILKQKTIQNEVSLSGVGLHTGNEVKMTFKPAPENHGFAFKRVDLIGSPTIEANAEFVVNTQRHKDIDAVVIQFVNTGGGYSWNLSEIVYNRIVKILKRQKSL